MDVSFKPAEVQLDNSSGARRGPGGGRDLGANSLLLHVKEEGGVNSEVI